MGTVAVSRVSVRSDFVKRAAILQEDCQFAGACGEAIMDWNRGFSEFAIRDEGIAFTRILHQTHEFLYPLRLEENRNVTRGLTSSLPLSGPERAAEYEARLSGKVARTAQRTIAAKHSWKLRILGLCNVFFPPCDYPSWMPIDQHPAHHFLAGCLINGPRFTDPEWILNEGLSTREIPLDPNDPSSVQRLPEVVYLREKCSVLEQTIRERIRRGGCIGEEDLSDAVRDAEEAGDQARREMGSIQRHFKVLPLHLGLTATDLKSNAQIIASEMSNDDQRRERARLLHHQGHNYSEIARTIGRSPKMVKIYVESE